MRISATGTWSSSPRRRPSGFTLIELLVVLLIIGIMIVGAVMSTNLGGGDRDLEKERDRILSLTDYLRDQAALQNREFGMRCFVGGYEFMVYNARTGLWQRLQDDPVTAPRRLPEGLSFALSIEGRPVVLPRATDKGVEPVPQIMLFSSGDLGLFELTLHRDADTKGFRLAPSPAANRIEATALTGST